MRKPKTKKFSYDECFQNLKNIKFDHKCVPNRAQGR